MNHHLHSKFKKENNVFLAIQIFGLEKLFKEDLYYKIEMLKLGPTFTYSNYLAWKELKNRKVEQLKMEF